MANEINFSDDYEHPDPNIEYLPESIEDCHLELAKYEFCGCSCLTSCSSEFCECLERSGARYEFDDRQNFNSYRIIENDIKKPFYECNRNCLCVGKQCGNRLVQFGPRMALKIIECKDKGLGLSTDNCISEGNFICEYAGEIISKDGVKRLFHEYKTKYSMNYILSLKEHFGDKSYHTIIDPTECGNIGRYINHSCEPNAKIYLMRINNQIPKACIFAITDIGNNEEICFSYGDSVSENNREKNIIPCLCGKEKCKKFLPFDEYCFE